MIRRHRTNSPMHRVRFDVPTSNGRLLENVYEHYVLVTDRWKLGSLTIWTWSYETNVQRRPIHELINRATTGQTYWPDQETYERLDPDALRWSDGVTACNGCGNAFSCTYPDCRGRP